MELHLTVFQYTNKPSSTVKMTDFNPVNYTIKHLSILSIHASIDQSIHPFIILVIPV